MASLVKESLARERPFRDAIMPFSTFLTSADGGGVLVEPLGL